GIGDGAVAIAAFNGDGIPDVLVTNHATGTVSLLPGNGDGTFRPRVRFAVGAAPIALAVGDFNGDNLPDVAVLNDVPFMSNDATIPVLLSDGRPSHPGPGPAPSRGHRGVRPGARPAPGSDWVTTTGATPDAPRPPALPLPLAAGVVGPARRDRPVTEAV